MCLTWEQQVKQLRIHFWRFELKISWKNKLHSEVWGENQEFQGRQWGKNTHKSILLDVFFHVWWNNDKIQSIQLTRHLQLLSEWRWLPTLQRWLSWLCPALMSQNVGGLEHVTEPLMKGCVDVRKANLPRPRDGCACILCRSSAGSSCCLQRKQALVVKTGKYTYTYV